MQKKVAPKIERYRTSALDAIGGPVENCNCQPGLYSVVYLTTDRPVNVTPSDVMPQMLQQGKKFVPSVLAIQVGTTVDFPNLDPFFHNVFSYSKIKKFDLGRYPQGSSARVTFDKPGITKVFCEIHASMRAYIHVLETPYFTVSNIKGQFSIDSIPAGDYTLTVWQEDLPDLIQTVRVRDDSTFVSVKP